MRIMVFFDLPTATKAERRAYAQFRKFLADDGYLMEQFSVYTRITLGRENMESHVDRLKKNLPELGDVHVLVLTEKQYADRLVLRNYPRRKNLSDGDIGTQLTLLF